jgi:hypothetical protein
VPFEGHLAISSGLGAWRVDHASASSRRARLTPSKQQDAAHSDAELGPLKQQAAASMGGRMTTERQSIRRWARAPPDQVESAVGEGSTKPWAGPFCAPAGRPTSGRTAGAERFPIDRAITTDPPAAGETRSYADRALELPARDAGQANMRLIGNSASSLER